MIEESPDRRCLVSECKNTGRWKLFLGKLDSSVLKDEMLKQMFPPFVRMYRMTQWFGVINGVHVQILEERIGSDISFPNPNFSRPRLQRLCEIFNEQNTYPEADGYRNPPGVCPIIKSIPPSARWSERSGEI
ncbi:hypothetical protein RF11_11281 [Thelohanellus kitauei]|uniref:Uncharacterized protein n=1 Tax=Thelohanellus kitauei TaxID=669202 RepID=A0A0C2MHP5_THEKT|nr:hypothetical protein RF11_11281 [Thelohanellus kitauei]